MKKVINTICSIIAIISFLIIAGEPEQYTAGQTALIKGISLICFIASIKGIERGTKEK